MTLSISTGIAQCAGITGAVAVLTAMPGCLRHLPPRPTPDAVVPATGIGAAPAPGHRRLVIDVVDGPTAVHQVTMKAEPWQDGDGRTRYSFSEAPETLCPTSPCALDRSPGNILLGFPVRGDAGTLDVELVHVGTQDAVYRRSLSHYDKNRGTLWVLGIIGTSLGSTSLITGTTLLPIGLRRDHDSLAAAGAISLGAGALLVTVGVLAIWVDSPTYRPGAAIHFPVEAPRSR